MEVSASCPSHISPRKIAASMHWIEATSDPCLGALEKYILTLSAIDSQSPYWPAALATLHCPVFSLQKKPTVSTSSVAQNVSVSQSVAYWNHNRVITLSSSFCRSHSGIAGMTCVSLFPTLMMVPSGGREVSSRGLKARDDKIEFRSSRQRS